MDLKGNKKRDAVTNNANHIPILSLLIIIGVRGR